MSDEQLAYAPTKENAAPSSEPMLASGKPPRRDDPGPVKQGLSAAQVKAMADKRAKGAARDAKMEEAGAVAGRELKAAQVGVVRSSLFNADDWKREHSARQQRMESTFSRLYKPQSGDYWVKKTKPPPRKPPPGQLPAYTNDLPAALSLAHASSREAPSDDDEDDDDDEEAVAPPAVAGPADFDPMAEPRRFYAEFKGRVSALKIGVKDNPTDRPTQSALLPRAADELIAAATRKSPPPPPPPLPPKLEAPTWSVGAGLSASNPILDEDFDVEPSLVYTESAHYLADHGVQIPMWDELDQELAQLDTAHESAMRALAVREPTTMAAPPPMV